MGIGAIMAALVIYWGGFFSDAVLRDGVPLLVFVLGLFLIAAKVGAFLSWIVQRKG